MALDASMLAPLVTSITSNAAILVPVGVTIMGILVSVTLIPRIINKFI